MGCEAARDLGQIAAYPPQNRKAQHKNVCHAGYLGYKISISLRSRRFDCNSACFRKAINSNDCVSPNVSISVRFCWCVFVRFHLCISNHKIIPPRRRVPPYISLFQKNLYSIHCMTGIQLIAVYRKDFPKYIFYQLNQ